MIYTAKLSSTSLAISSSKARKFSSPWVSVRAKSQSIALATSYNAVVLIVLLDHQVSGFLELESDIES